MMQRRSNKPWAQQHCALRAEDHKLKACGIGGCAPPSGISERTPRSLRHSRVPEPWPGPCRLPMLRPSRLIPASAWTNVGNLLPTNGSSRHSPVMRLRSLPLSRPASREIRPPGGHMADMNRMAARRRNKLNTRPTGDPCIRGGNRLLTARPDTARSPAPRINNRSVPLAAKRLRLKRSA